MRYVDDDDLSIVLYALGYMRARIHDTACTSPEEARKMQALGISRHSVEALIQTIEEKNHARNKKK